MITYTYTMITYTYKMITYTNELFYYYERVSNGCQPVTRNPLYDDYIYIKDDYVYEWTLLLLRESFKRVSARNP